jgi:choline-sulfatase
MAKSSAPRTTNRRSGPAAAGSAPGRSGALVVAIVLAIALAGMALWFVRGRDATAGAVIVVSIDTLRADRLAIYGYAGARTPVTTALAADAVVFDRAYAHAPQTLPSHASMFTGRLPFEHKVRDNLGFTLEPGAVTLAGLFKHAGYATAGFVSAYVLRPDTGISQGFDHYDATFPAMAADRSPAQVQRPGSDTVDAAMAWLRTQTSPRFFLFLHLYEPHKPWRAPDRFAELDAYDGEVAFSDELTGKVVAELRSRGWYDDATVIVLSDHGEGLGDHIEEEHGLFLYDEVIRVPWVMKLPAQANRGTRVQEPVQHIDLLPTLAEMYGLRIQPADLRGRDLSPLLFGRGSIAPQGIYAEALYPRYHFGWSELLSLTDERYRYIKAPREELYDLARDPKERANLAAERPQAAAALRSGLESLIANRAIDAPAAVSDADRQRLAALGYVGTQAPSAGPSGETRADPKDKAPLLRDYRRAIEALGEGRLDEGTTMLRRILELDPDMVDVWSQYGSALSRAGRHEEAFEAYARMIRLQPDEPNGALGAAAALLALNRLPEARAHAELAIRTAPSQAYQALALIDIAGKQAASALENAALAAKAEPGLPMVAFVRGTLEYDAGRYAEAVPPLLEARKAYAQRSSQPRDLYFMLGDALARLDRYREAEPYLLQEIRLYPQHVRARAALAMLYQAAGREAEAERVLNSLVLEVPTRDGYGTAASVRRMFGQATRAAALDAEARARFRVKP